MNLVNNCLLGFDSQVIIFQTVYDFAGCHEGAIVNIRLTNSGKEVPCSSVLTMSDVGLVGRVLLTMECLQVSNVVTKTCLAFQSCDCVFDFNRQVRRSSWSWEIHIAGTIDNTFTWHACIPFITLKKLPLSITIMVYTGLQNYHGNIVLHIMWIGCN